MHFMFYIPECNFSTRLMSDVDQIYCATHAIYQYIGKHPVATQLLLGTVGG